ncbi:hypothetical protein [Kangiella geojedonensis]|uniref:Lipoprotein n=1 Tax=Kangiella geojedonensis TaxID=914150 RepID=A0A0F6TQ01_9GAMM|nr:hypothetical protein [Kangiella geojedonensis]AKE51552.1 hypothetical protein TQ33_0571 [Kangiella geojedonensis]
MFYRLLLLTAFLLISGCSTLKNTKTLESKTKVFLGVNHVLHYDGGINKDANKRIFELYRSLPEKPTKLQITSKGGDVMEGIRLGNWVFDNQLDVIVGKGCASSCANYVFPAGTKKYLYKDSALIWHGNSYQENVNDRVEQGEQNAVNWRTAENRFYKRINVHPLLGEYGHKELKLTFWNFLYHYFNETLGYDYSIEDMKKFGLTNIQLLDGVWEWRKYRPYLEVLRVDVNPQDLESLKPH